MARIAVMKVWNVELGLAVHVRAPNGKYVVIDLGASKDVSPVKELSKQSGLCVHYLVLTHPHKDHFDDILNVHLIKPIVLSRVHNFSEAEIMNGAGDEKEKFQAYCDFVKKYNEDVDKNHENSPRNGRPLGGLIATTFQASHCDKNNINNFSKVVVLELGKVKIVVCGDPEREALSELLANKVFRNKIQDSAILVAPHHGRESSYLEEFVDLVNPRLTIVSDTTKCDTSAVEAYGKKSSGYDVWNTLSKVKEKRNCLTTRKDGNIEVVFGDSDDAQYIGTLSVKCHC